MNVNHTLSRTVRLVLVLVPVLAALVAATGCSSDKTAADRLPQVASAPPAGTVGKEQGEVWTTGFNTDGQLARRTAKTMDVALGPAVGVRGSRRLSGAKAVAGGGRHGLAIMASGQVVAWGANDKGQLGDGTKIKRPTPVPVLAPEGRPGTLTDAVAISADTDFSMALLRDGTAVTWGTGDAGQRGIGRKAAPPTPTTVKRPDGRGPLTGVAAIAADGRTELALLENGTVLGWGANKYGMVGDGTTKDRSLPRPVRGLDNAPRLSGVTQVAVGGQHGLALLRDGTAAAWGRNDNGQLGDGTQKDRLTPAPVTGPHGLPVLRNVIAVTAGEKHNFALRGDGTAVAWGDNLAGQLGNGTVSSAFRPTQILGVHGSQLRGVAQIYAGESYGVAVLSDSTALTWGAGGKGQLGSGNRIPRSRPGPVVLAGGRAAGRVFAVGAGQRHLQLLMRW